MIKWTDAQGAEIQEGDCVLYSETQFPGGYAEQTTRAGIAWELLPEGVSVFFTSSAKRETVPPANLLVVDMRGYHDALIEEAGKE